MKKYLLIPMLLLLLLTTPVQAEEVDCETYGSIAYRVMINRQAGVAMSQHMTIVGDNHILQQIVIQAYNEPRRSYERAKQIAAEEYRDVWYSACVVVMLGEGE